MNRFVWEDTDYVFLDDSQSLEKLNNWLEKQPPRPGLVPKSGDWQHPYRWIRPKETAPSLKQEEKLDLNTIPSLILRIIEKSLSDFKLLRANQSHIELVDSKGNILSYSDEVWIYSGKLVTYYKWPEGDALISKKKTEFEEELRSSRESAAQAAKRAREKEEFEESQPDDISLLRRQKLASIQPSEMLPDVTEDRAIDYLTSWLNRDTEGGSYSLLPGIIAFSEGDVNATKIHAAEAIEEGWSPDEEGYGEVVQAQLDEIVAVSKKYFPLWKRKSQDYLRNTYGDTIRVYRGTRSDEPKNTPGRIRSFSLSRDVAREFTRQVNYSMKIIEKDIPIEDVLLYLPILTKNTDEGKSYEYQKEIILNKSMIEKQDQPQAQFSELDANMQQVDFRVRSFLIGLLQDKVKIEQELESSDLGVQREMDLENALQVIENIIAKIRFNGFYDEDVESQ